MVSRRAFKQIIIGAVFLLAFSLVGFSIYRGLREEPTCFDGRRNQGEEGTDCGVICGNTCLDQLKALEIPAVNLFRVQESFQDNDYDILLKVRNPNVRFGASQFKYEISLFNVDNELIGEQSGFGYILPGQVRYLFIPRLVTKIPARRAEARITMVEWARLGEGLSGNIFFDIRNKEFHPEGKPGIASFVQGSVFNATDFDFEKADVIAVAVKNGQPIAANKTDLRTFRSHEERIFTMDWIFALPVTPDYLEVEAYTNVFESENFISRYGTQEKFQRLY